MKRMIDRSALDSSLSIRSSELNPHSALSTPPSPIARGHLATVLLAVTVFAGLLLGSVEALAGQVKTRRMGLAALTQSGRQQRPPDRPLPQQITPGRRGEPNRPGANRAEERRGDFTRQELSLLPPGISRAPALLLVFRQLNLSPEQQERLRNSARLTGNQLPVLNRLRRAQNEALEEAIHGTNFDPKVVEQRAADLAATQAEIIKVQARVMSQIRQVLTQEQAQRFRELLDDERRRAIEGQPPQNQQGN
jgi:Spy/CpxP family protein refolding chaperone